MFKCGRGIAAFQKMWGCELHTLSSDEESSLKLLGFGRSRGEMPLKVYRRVLTNYK